MDKIIVVFDIIGYFYPMLLSLKKSIVQEVAYRPEGAPAFRFWIKREDLLHEHISGNKYRKLRYNLEQAKADKHDTLLTFGGAFSNHIAATAAAGNELGFKTIGVIRGDELADEKDLNPTLNFARSQGMQFVYMDRQTYRKKTDAAFIAQLHEEFGRFYLVPEGGTNALAVKGCEEILTEDDKDYDYISVAIGTGGTISGIINVAAENQKVLGFPALKGDFLADEIKKYVTNTENWRLYNYHFGGFAKIDKKLITFINDFKKQTGVQLDPVYTGKMAYGVIDMLKRATLSSKAKILMIHTGGLQGIQGMNIRLQTKNLPTLK